VGPLAKRQAGRETGCSASAGQATGSPLSRAGPTRFAQTGLLKLVCSNWFAQIGLLNLVCSK